MTRRRSVLLATGLCAVAALAVTSDVAAHGPGSARLLGSDTAQHASGQAAQHQPGSRGHGAGSGSHTAAGGDHRDPGDRHASRTDRSHPRGTVAQRAVAGGAQEAGEQESVTKRVDYTGADSTTFRYPGASYVKVHFTRLLVRPGDYVTVSDPAGKQAYTYRADPRLLDEPKDSPTTDSGPDGFWSMSVTGEAAVVRLHKSLPGPGLGKFGVDIDKVAHGFTSSQRADRDHNEMRAAGGHRPESVCGSDDSRDAVCYRTSNPVQYKHSLPVARLLINGTTLCTAWRLTAADRMLTNHHCLGNQADVSNTEVWFNYQCSRCGGKATERVTKVPGAKLLRTDKTLDYTLFSVGDFGSIKNFGYLGLDVRTPKTGEQVYIPQHPEGDPTKLAIASDSDPNSTCQIEQAKVDGYATATDTAYRCDTAPGASGSPVISRHSNKVIALHHFGGCPNSGVRIDLIYRQIKSQL